MGRLVRGGLRGRLVVLVLLAVFPSFVLIFVNAREQRDQGVQVAQDRALSVVRRAVAEYDRHLEGVRQLLVGLAGLPPVRLGEAGACRAIVTDLQRQLSSYLNLGVRRPDGTLLASALPAAAIEDPAAPHFKRALQGVFGTGYRMDPVSGKSELHFGYPVFDDQGRVSGVVFAALGLGWLQGVAPQLRGDLPSEAVLWLFDRNGAVLERIPGDRVPLGMMLNEAGPVIALASVQGDGATTLASREGDLQLAAYAALGGAPADASLFAAVLMPQAAAFAEADRALVRNLAGLGLAALLALGLAWLGAELFLLRHVRRLVRITEQVRTGRLPPRAARADAPGELGVLAGVMDEMASAIVHRQEEAARALQSLRDSEESYRLLYEANPFPMFVYDPATMAMLAVNDAAIRHYGYTRDAFMTMRIPDLHPPEEVDALIRFLADHPPGLSAVGLWRHRKRDGSWIEVEVTSRGIPFGGRLARLALVHDITDRRRAEEEREALQRLVQRLSGPLTLREVGRVVAQESRRLFRHDAFLFSMLDEGGEHVLGIYAEDTAAGAAEPVEVPLAASLPRSRFGPESPALAGRAIRIDRREEEAPAGTIPFGFPDRRSRSLLYVPIRWEERQVGVLSVQSYEPGRYDEKALRLLEAFASACGGVLARLRAQQDLHESEERYRTLAQTASVGIWHVDPAGLSIYVNPAMCDLLEIDSPDELAGTSFHRFFTPESLAVIEREQENRAAGRRSAYEVELVGKRGRRRSVSVTAAPLVGVDGRLQSVIGTFVDITERKEAQEQSRRQLDRLSALRTIDMTITASMDLRLTLHTLLDQAIAQLRADAADVLRLNPQTQMLNYAAGRGFRSASPFTPPVRVGEGLAGRAALDRRIVSVPNLAESREAALPSCRAAEGFASYVVVPLIARGLVKGVLEIYHRRLFYPDREWLDFLDAVASQAAIAIDNATLFKDLQRSSAELGVAYDSTLEGWSHALDLRDRETVGHSQRVTDVTLRLARAMNLAEADLIHVRRGALLHDIGKMGIPDNILHKPGVLTEEEWEIMKRHPAYAFKMLWPIAYLRPAIDIPYCHHVKWDGTGYPRGLKGTEIPLPARLFAVVDVWDALSSDRPYRKAWPAEKVREHIRSLSGTHFDPDVVKVFLELDLSRTIREEAQASILDGPVATP